MNRYILSFLIIGIVFPLFSCKKRKVVSSKIINSPIIPSENRSSLIYIASNDRLAYNRYANAGDLINRIPDFSNVGYKAESLLVQKYA